MLNKIQPIKRLLLLGGLAPMLAAPARAVDQYNLEIPTVVMAGDPDIAFTVDPRQGAEADSTSHQIRFKNLPTGFRITPGDFGSGAPVSGKTRFQLTVDGGMKPGRHLLRVEKSDDAKISATAAIQVQPPVAKFMVAPADLKFTRKIGDPLTVQILAQDAQGAVISSFKGDVDLTAALGSLDVTSVPGAAFKNGAAQATVHFAAANPNGSNRLTASARNYFLRSGEHVQGALDVSLSAKKAAR